MTNPPPDIAINLSYVLHERSDSAVVARYASDIERERRGRDRLSATLNRLSVDELRQRIVLEHELPRFDQSTFRIISLKIGVWTVLDTVLAAACPTFVRANISTHLVDNDCETLTTRDLFRAPAGLCVPDAGTPVDAADYFAAALVRPGGNSIQLRLEPLVSGGLQNNWKVTGKILEKTIREFVLQWDCDRSLWSSPAEVTLPEFGQDGLIGEDA